jgi:hypothetical protein
VTSIEYKGIPSPLPAPAAAAVAAHGVRREELAEELGSGGGRGGVGGAGPAVEGGQGEAAEAVREPLEAATSDRDTGGGVGGGRIAGGGAGGEHLVQPLLDPPAGSRGARGEPRQALRKFGVGGGEGGEDPVPQAVPGHREVAVGRIVDRL